MKNSMRFACLLLALVLVTSCMVGGTFAKYVTSNNGTDSARVAKWGVTLSATNADGLFAESYKAPTGDAVTVKSDTTGTDVVAPGTSGSFGGFTVSGTPEVSTAVSYTATVNLTGNWEKKDGTFYFPLTIKVGETAVDLSSVTDASGVQSAIKTAIENNSATYNPGATVAAGLGFSWSWDIGEASEDDTMLGDIAAGKITGKTAPNISIDVTATITQVD